MVVAAIIIAIITRRKDYSKLLFDQYAMKNVITGLSTGIGSFMYIIFLMLNGVATAFTLSQMSTIVGTLGGIIILREHKTNKELIYTISGLACAVLGGVLIGIFG